jgi:N-glycosylase/DNA lyase
MALKDAAKISWWKLNVSKGQLNPSLTMAMGQCFAWRALKSNSHCEDDKVWVGVLCSVPVAIKQSQNETFVANLQLPSHPTYLSQSDFINLMVNYFQLHYDLESLYREWRGNCTRMKLIADALPGVRVVKQDPWECLASFICSSNNNIKRITMMLNRLRHRYGNYICSIVKFNPITDTLQNEDRYLIGVWFVSYRNISTLPTHEIVSLVKSPNKIRKPLDLDDIHQGD